MIKVAKKHFNIRISQTKERDKNKSVKLIQSWLIIKEKKVCKFLYSVYICLYCVFSNYFFLFYDEVEHIEKVPEVKLDCTEGNICQKFMKPIFPKIKRPLK